jgi:phosphatidylglycerophosphatase A
LPYDLAGKADLASGYLVSGGPSAPHARHLGLSGSFAPVVAAAASRTLAYGLVVLLLGAGSIYLSHRAEMLLGQPDSPVIVIDEVVGQLIALAACPVNFFAVGLGVLLFRAFDIFKPFPIGLINDRLGGGLGIVLDDVIAGIYAGLILIIVSGRVFS